MRFVSILVTIASVFVACAGFGFSAQAQDDESCFMCHGDPDATTTSADGKIISLYVDQEAYLQTVHAPMGCIACHSDVEELPHPEGLAAVDCGSCHLEMEEYQTSAHGIAFSKGDSDLSGCTDCHGVHDIRASADVLSRTHPLNLPETCGKCHSNPALVKRHMVSVADPSHAYLQSVHAKAIASGEIEAAVCNDCHGSHNILPAHNPESPVYRRNIASTCGKCHGEAETEFSQSIHGQAFEAGIPDAPTCTNCHGEHTIEAPELTASTVSSQQVSRTTCPRCHDDEKVMEKYGIATMRQASYMDSYHGMAGAAGATVVANCTSCHGVHDILPEEDPASSVHPSNLPGTCGKCHEDAGPNFAIGKVHIMPTDPGQRALGIVRLVYIWLLILVLGGMVAHNTLLMGRHMLMKFGVERRGKGTHQRFNKGQVVGHMVLSISFIVLAISGFALRYPEAWWSQLIFRGPGFEIRSWVHRISGSVLIFLTVFNIVYIIATRGGRKELRSLIMTWKDVKDVFVNLRYGFGFSNVKPKFDRYTYSEKFEYWGLWWGSVLMAVTGLCMWFADEFLSVFPKIALDVMALIHYYEAWLAVGTIVIWHFYYMIFDPETYPMNWSWITGRITEEDYVERHPLEYEREVRGGSQSSEGSSDAQADEEK